MGGAAPVTAGAATIRLGQVSISKAGHGGANRRLYCGFFDLRALQL
jgi:hypothetical protein